MYPNTPNIWIEPFIELFVDLDSIRNLDYLFVSTCVAKTLILLSFGFLFAFVSVGGRSFPTILLNFLHFTAGPKTYIWKKGLPADLSAKALASAEASSSLEEGIQKPKVKLVKESKIKTLATHVETNK